MSARMTIWAAPLLHASVSTAAAHCAAAITTFEAVITSDAESGNLNKGVRRIVGELAGVKASCSAGRDAEASRAREREGAARVPVSACEPDWAWPVRC